MDLQTDRSMVDFPPMYTLQPNDESRRRQISQWVSQVLNYSKNNLVFLTAYPDIANTSKEQNLQEYVSIGATEDRILLEKLFKNDKIQRTADPRLIEMVLDELVHLEKAMPAPSVQINEIPEEDLDEPLPLEKSKIVTKANTRKLLILWHSISEWADQLAIWVNSDFGPGSKAVMTVFELLSKDSIPRAPVAGMPRSMFTLIANLLEEQGRVAIFATTSSELTSEGFLADDVGIKFM